MVCVDNGLQGDIKEIPGYFAHELPAAESAFGGAAPSIMASNVMYSQVPQAPIRQMQMRSMMESNIAMDEVPRKNKRMEGRTQHAGVVCLFLNFLGGCP